ncbi:deoxyribonuclease TATDN1 [Hyalella azteca]|uniref:Deoxyribonuclease TATDN1 n=1 Tax=Hyalella azteca TaxID=294128 RepID=A0A8B7NDD3_HYAAZ|nr:deoxyribonuclease TATDN1 [Hyalella azteca]
MLKQAGTRMYKFIDIGANLCDGMYQGEYHGSKKHAPDLDAVLARATHAGLEKIIVTGTSLQESREAVQLARANKQLYCTVGCHPTRCGEFTAQGSTPEEYLAQLLQLIQDGCCTADGKRAVVVAVGECGLDYARLNFCDADTQKTYFEQQLTLAEVSGLPLFLHCRDAAADLISILTPWRDRVAGGVVHSFDGTKQELADILDLDLYVGINGCSLRTEENLAVAASVPLERLLLETDSPWCEVKATHAGYRHVKTHFADIRKKEKWQPGAMVKGRNEPACIVQVLEALAGAREEDPQVVAQAAFDNAIKLFFSAAR